MYVYSGSDQVGAATLAIAGIPYLMLSMYFHKNNSEPISFIILIAVLLFMLIANYKLLTVFYTRGGSSKKYVIIVVVTLIINIIATLPAIYPIAPHYLLILWLVYLSSFYTRKICKLNKIHIEKLCKYNPIE